MNLKGFLRLFVHFFSHLIFKSLYTFIKEASILNQLFFLIFFSGESTEISKTKNRSCIMTITAYYANVTDTNVQKGDFVIDF